MKPLISFCIPTYNRAQLVKNCIQKILEYDGNDIEVVVVNNDSPDNTEEVIASINDKRVSYYKNNTNLGVSLNIIETIKRAKGEWIFTLSDEDHVPKSITLKLINILKMNFCKSVGVILGNLNKVYNDQHIRYNTALYRKGDQAILNVGFQHLYLSGIIIKKAFIDNNYLESFSVEGDGIYPHVNIYSLVCKNADALTVDTNICINGLRVNKRSFIEQPNLKSFKHPNNRLWQFKIFSHMASQIIDNDHNIVLKTGSIYDHFLKLSTYHWENIIRRESEYYRLKSDSSFNFEAELKRFHTGALAHINNFILSNKILNQIKLDFELKNYILKQRRKEFLENQKNEI